MISVIMGIYNCSLTLARSIESILNQTYTNLELIICDDGSTDNSLIIAESYRQKDNRIVILKNEHNMGLSFTLNKCILHSKGVYIARMDGDDVSHIDRLEKQINFLERNSNYSFCGCTINFFDEDGVWGNRVYPEKPTNKDFLVNSPYCHPALLFRKDALINVNNYHTKGVGRSEDYDLFMRLHAVGFLGYNISECLFDYCEARFSYSKRKFKYCFYESLVRLRGYKKLKLLPQGLIYVGRPILIGLIPLKLRMKLHKRRYETYGVIK